MRAVGVQVNMNGIAVSYLVNESIIGQQYIIIYEL